MLRSIGEDRGQNLSATPASVVAMKKTYQGSCHCKRVRFEADLDIAAGTGKCNCSYCWKVRNWSMIVKPDALRVLAGEEELTRYSFGSGQAGHLFCKHCGVRPFGRGDVPELGGPYVSVVLSALDDLDPAELVAGPVRHFNGRDDAWLTPPAEVRHL